jgi:N-acetylmuramoyl-L-alanine amidase
MFKNKKANKVIIGILSSAFIFCTGGLVDAQASTIYNVKSGDTLAKVSVSTKTPITVIMSTNALNNSKIYANSTLKIPAKHTTKNGDTMYKVGKASGVSLPVMQLVNHNYTNSLSVGQTVYVPNGVTVKTTTSQITVGYSQAEIDLISRLVNAEAGGEPYLGKVAVANVVLNRVKSKDFPNTVHGVIYEMYGSNKTIPAFSPVANGSINNPASEDSKKAVLEAINGNENTGGALFFYNPDKVSSNNWIRSLAISFRIGNHVFCK